MKRKIQRKFKSTLLKGLMVLMFGMIGEVSWGQTHFESGDGWGTAGWNSYTAMTQMPSGSGKYGINLSNTATGNKYFRTANGSGTNRYGPAGNSDVLLAKDGTQNTLEDWNSGNGKANYINVSNTGYTYAFRTNGATSKQMIIFEVQGAISTISNVTQSPVAASVCPGGAVTVTATLSGSFSTGQGAYLRYTNDNFSTSTIVAMTGSGTTYTANIPAGTNTAGANVKYYVFTSGSGLTITSANADFYTINLNNNSGSNYSYTVNATTSISSQSTATQTVFLGGTSGNFSPITVTAAGAGLTYQWYSNTSASNTAGSTLGMANGAQTSSYTPQATSVGTLYYYCIVTGTCSFATSAVSGAFIVNSLNNPSPTTPFSATISSLALVWAKNAQAHNVMIVRSTTNSFTDPTNGTAYTVGNTIGSGTVIYNSFGTSFTDASLSGTTTYYYAFYSENYSYYSAGVTASATTSGFISTQAGNWSSTSTWVGGVVPSSGADVFIAHNVTLDQDATVSSLTINSGTFTASDNTARTLTISKTASATTLVNSGGTWANGTGGSTVNFTGSGSSANVLHTVSGTLNLNNVVINKTIGASYNVGVAFGSNGKLASGGKLTIGNGGYLSSSASDFYTANGNTTLEFSNSGGYTVNGGDVTWPSSSLSAPANINITLGTVTLNSARTASGNLNISGGGLTLNADLVINGNWTRSSGSFTPNTSTVTLSGSTAQTIDVTGGATMYNLIVNNSAGVNFSTGGLTINDGGALTLTAGTLSLASNYNLTIGSTALGTCTISRNAGGLSFGTGTLVPTAANIDITYNNAADITTGVEFSATNTKVRNLSISSTSTYKVTLNNANSISGNLTIGSGTILADGGYTLTTLGASIVNSGIHSGAGTIRLARVSGDQTITGTGTFQNLENAITTSGNMVVGSNFNIAGNFTNSSQGVRGLNNTITFTGTGNLVNNADMYGEFGTNTLSLVFDGNTTLSGSTGYLDAKNYTVNTNRTLDCGTIGLNTNSISPASGTITVNGTLKIANSNGLWNNLDNTTTIRKSSGNFSTITIASGSTIEYNAAGAQTVSSNTGIFNGYGNLTISGSGVKTIASATTIAGTTTVTSGTLSVAADNHLGASNIVLGGGTLGITTGFSTNKTITLTASTTSTIDVASGQTLTANGAITGSGSLTKTSAGTLVLGSASNNISGTITITAGTINVTGVTGISSTAFGATTQSITFSSTTPANGTYQLFNGPVSVTQSFSSNADVTKVVSFDYTSGVVSVSSAPVLTLSQTNLSQFTTQSLTRNTTTLPIARFQVDVTVGTATLSSASFSTTGDNTNCNYLQTDITNFKLYYTIGTSFTSPTLVTGATTQTSGKALTNSSETITFSSLTQTLAIGTYYFWITADILDGATAGRNIAINTQNITASVGSVSGTGTATGIQTIVAAAPTNYYLQQSAAGTAANWNTATNGTGTALSSITASDANLIVDDESAATITGDLSLGNNSKIIVSQGVTAKLTISTAMVTGTIDVGSAGTLEINTSSIPTLGTLTAGSTVIYGASVAQAVTTKNYTNLTISGGNTKTISGAAAVSGTLVINNTILALGSNNLSPANLTLDGLGTRSGTWGSTAGAATYKNDTYFSGTGVVTVTNNTALTPSISGVTASQSITYGAASITLTGTVSATGPLYPANGETVSVTINGSTQTTTTTGGNGSFSINFTTNTIPVSASNYTIAYAYSGNGFLNAASNNTATTLTVNAATNAWGGSNGTWSTAGNWSLSRVPSSLNDNITISSGTPTLDVNYTLGTGRTLTLSGSAALIINPSSSITIAGTADFGGKSVTVKSDGSGTGAIGTISGTLSNATNVTVERYIGAPNGSTNLRGRWRFLSSPVSGKTIADWKSQFYITGPCTNSPASEGIANDQGWDANLANILFPSSTFSSDPKSVKTTSIRTYTESTSGDINLGWANLTGTGQSLAMGQGFRAYIRGAKNYPSDTAQQLGTLANSNSQSALTLSLTGSVYIGDRTMPVTATPTNGTWNSANDGWNLLGNPYACAYDWTSNATDKTNMSNAIYVFDAINNNYKGYNASTPGGNLNNGIIPSGAAFFVQTGNPNSGTPALIFKEAGKVTGSAPSSVHKGAKTNEFTIKYSKDSSENDELMIILRDNATMNKDGFDINKLRNENLNLASYGEDSMQLMLSAIPPIVSETRIKLNVEATVIATYHFDFKNMDNFDAGVSVHLFDRYTNKTTDVRKNTKYTFDMGAGVNQWGNNRFELILNLDKTGVDEFALLNQTQMLVYPNPATDVLNINISNSSFKNSDVVVYNISGTEVIKTNMAKHNAQLNIETLSNGVYFVKVTNQNGFNKTVKFVK